MKETKAHIANMQRCDAVESVLIAAGPLTSHELAKHPAMQATYTTAKALGQSLAYMHRKGRIIKRGTGTKRAKWSIISHTEAKTGTGVKKDIPVRLVFNRDLSALNVELGGVRFQISVAG
jgi:hypothetical protein